MRRDWLLESGAELAPDELIITDEAPKSTSVVPAALAERQVTPPAIEARQLANPFLAPDLSKPVRKEAPRRRLDGWELMGPLYKAFEIGAGGSAASMELPEVPEYDRLSPKGLEVMPHQSRFLEAVRLGHRSFLLADEPGLGKTAESVIAASVAGAYPLLAVVPNVVKMNWAREVERWTPQRRATVIQGDGDDIDAFADVFIVNYEILDRHLSWLGSARAQGHGRRRGALHQEPHQPAVAERARARHPHPRDHARPADARAHGYAAHQRRRGLRRDLALPRLDDGRQARSRADGEAGPDGPDARPTRRSTPRRAMP